MYGLPIWNTICSFLMASSSLPHRGLRKLPPFLFYTGMRKLYLQEWGNYTSRNEETTSRNEETTSRNEETIPTFLFYPAMRKRGGRKLYISTCFIQLASDTRLSHTTRVTTLWLIKATNLQHNFASAFLITIVAFEQMKHIQHLLPTEREEYFSAVCMCMPKQTHAWILLGSQWMLITRDLLALVIIWTG